MSDDGLNYHRRRTETELERAPMATRSQGIAARYQSPDAYPGNAVTIPAGARCDHA